MTNEQQIRDCQKWMGAKYTNLQLIRLGLLSYIYLCYVLKKTVKFENSMLWNRTEEEGQLNYISEFIEWIKKCKNKEIVLPLLSSLNIHSSVLRMYKKLAEKCKGQKVEPQTNQQQTETIALVKQIFDDAIEIDEKAIPFNLT